METIERPTGMAKFHALIYSLLFPGFLAAFILSQFTNDTLIDGLPPWGWLLCVYFAVQFVEGHESKSSYRLGRAAVNVLEMGVMVLIFAALGYFPDLDVGDALRSRFVIAFMMFFVFALPATYRLIFQNSTLMKSSPNYWFSRCLTAMSLLAAVLSSVFIAERWAWIVILIMLLAYMTAFQFCNDWLIDRLETKRWLRPWVSAFRRP